MSSFVLKIIAIITMLIDHIGVSFFPHNLIWRYIGRLAFPLFAFQIGQGFANTRSKEKYIYRMLIFALVSQIPYMLFNNVAIHGKFILNIGFTLTLGLLTLYCLDNIKNNVPLKLLVIIGILLISFYMPIDYGLYGVSLILLMYIFKDNIPQLSLSVLIATLIYCNLKEAVSQLYCLLSLIFISFYNHKKGLNCKWLFYVFYPLHLILIYFIKLITDI